MARSPRKPFLWDVRPALLVSLVLPALTGGVLAQGSVQGATGIQGVQAKRRAPDNGSSIRPNVLVLMADDLGVDMLSAYGEGADLPLTPNIDALAADGVLFRNVWSHPNCSPTRAGVQTGRHAFRTGIGHIVGTTGPALAQDEVTLPELLDLDGDYAHALIGKWHLGNGTTGGALSVNLAGWSHFSGSLFSLEPQPISYFMWPRIIDGNVGTATKYATTHDVDAAIKWIAKAPEPWVCFVSFQAPHGPYHTPPAGLYSEDLSGLLEPPNGPPRPFYKAMVEAMDSEIGRLLAAVEAPNLASEPLIFFTGDNGTPGEVTVAPFDPAHAKGTVYEGGINVPLIASGAYVVDPGRESTALIHTLDLFATIAAVAGANPNTLAPGVKLDSRSFLGHLRKPLKSVSQPFLVTESFESVGLPPSNPVRAIRDQRYKLIRRPLFDELYDLQVDPFEASDLLTGKLSTAEQTAYDLLATTLVGVLASN